MKCFYDYSSANYDDRESSQITYVILHYTEMEFQDAVDHLCRSNTKVSCHYLIKNDGKIFSLVPEDKKAWHAGVSAWRESVSLNTSSIGIELDNNGQSEFPDSLIGSALELCMYLKNKYNIKTQNFLGHSDIAFSRKIDPGILFPWRKLASHGIGMWHDIGCAPDKDSVLLSFGSKGQEVSRLQTHLNSLGYRLEITNEFDMDTNYVIRAFQSHFYPEIILSYGGLEFYRRPESLYPWTIISDKILNKLIELYV